MKLKLAVQNRSNLSIILKPHLHSVIFVILKIRNCTILKTVITTETTQYYVMGGKTPETC
jgi:hypothetical protein